MQKRFVVMTAAAVAVTGLAACSSEPQANHPSQASVTINGNTVGSTGVTCTPQVDNVPGRPLQLYRTITIGDQKVSGVKAWLNSSGDKLVANSVHILNLGGFTGMYGKDDGGEANVSFSSETYTITGTADGFNTYTPGEPATATFKIVATC